ncbi:poly [ADP-ribose] polymerase 1, partial [Myotis lucifugus]|uniref:poly [ADP-ribose] polymerase 1 n=1 Tax=Myotis lucifugus TaxID=59463 RepID=UPI0003C46015
MFDGKVPHWYHFSCFWKTGHSIWQPDVEVDGFSELRWDDQQKVKKTAEAGGVAGKGHGGAGGKPEKTLGDFAAEYAKSNRSTCKGCLERIDKGQVRLSKKMLDPEKPQLGMIDRWYHPECFVEHREELGFRPEYSASLLKGFSQLAPEDKEALEKQLPGVKSEVKRKGDEVDGLDQVPKKKPKKEKDKLEKALKAQNDLIWNTKDELKKACSTNDLKELLIFNKQQVPSGESAILDRVADGIVFGALLPCEECSGQLVFKSDAYYCTGDITAWTKCMVRTQTPSRKEWVTPKLRGPASVTGLERSGHVLEKGGKVFSATLGLVDIVKGTNSYYKLQLLEDDKGSRYWIFRSWGRVGTVIGSNKLEQMPSKEDAVEHFMKLYEEKTGNAWHSENFTKYPKKFYPLEIDYGQDEEAVKKLTVNPGTKSKLPKPVQNLIKMIFDVESMKKAMVEYEIDLQKMPLGKLSKRQIQAAYSILSEVQQALSQGSSDSQILDLSNRFYTLIPHDFGMKKPPLLSNADSVQAKVEMLDNLLDIEVAYSLLRGGSDDSSKDPIDVNYEKLKTDIKVVDKDSEEAKIIRKYVKNTHATTHNAYDLKVLEIFKIEREGENQRYKPFKQLHNRRLLWHGSRTTNFAGILSQGLRIAPPEAPVTGYMFGKGIYFADMVSKSANYCHTSQGDPVGLVLLGEVALGNMYELKHALHVSKLPKGKHSVKGECCQSGGSGPAPWTLPRKPHSWLGCDTAGGSFQKLPSLRLPWCQSCPGVCEHRQPLLLRFSPTPRSQRRGPLGAG